jgi:hypothetical protein
MEDLFNDISFIHEDKFRYNLDNPMYKKDMNKILERISKLSVSQEYKSIEKIDIDTLIKKDINTDVIDRLNEDLEQNNRNIERYYELYRQYEQNGLKNKRWNLLTPVEIQLITDLNNLRNQLIDFLGKFMK